MNGAITLLRKDAPDADHYSPSRKGRGDADFWLVQFDGYKASGFTAGLIYAVELAVEGKG
jgi:hypothetical protein